MVWCRAPEGGGAGVVGLSPRSARSAGTSATHTLQAKSNPLAATLLDFRAQTGNKDTYLAIRKLYAEVGRAWLLQHKGEGRAEADDLEAGAELGAAHAPRGAGSVSTFYRWLGFSDATMQGNVTKAAAVDMLHAACDRAPALVAAAVWAL